MEDVMWTKKLVGNQRMDKYPWLAHMYIYVMQVRWNSDSF